MDVLVNLKAYLARLKIAEKAKPNDEQRPVPTLKELAAVVGMHPSPFQRWADNQIGKLDRQVMAKIIHEMRRRGFDMEISDLLLYISDEE